MSALAQLALAPTPRDTRGNHPDGPPVAIAGAVDPATGSRAHGAPARHPLPDSPRRIRVGMPQLDASGLSENWLLRYAGDLQWEAIARRLGVSTDEIRGESGERLYPTVVAVRGRYPASLAAVRENDVLDVSVEVVPAGRACAFGRIVTRFGDGGGGAGAGEQVLALELLTTFAVRSGAAGAMRMMPPRAELARRWTAPDGTPPALARLARAARRGERLDDAFAGPPLARAALGALPLGTITHEPSPYTDYNGAGLLYFASYVTLADGAERQVVHRLGLAEGAGARQGGPTADWALSTSAIRRDVYYYENLPLGTALTAALLGFEREAGIITTHLRLARADDGRRMADVITRRRWAGGTPGR